MTTPEPTTTTPTGPPAIIIDSLSCSHDQLNSASYILPRYSRILMNECGLLPNAAGEPLVAG
eukprot:CAMPEP_0194423078 /NCGR_PEP_ID=MMETSP0176-20130528/22380_1 /TAXON_ID=216777 /ORGANISM="Proboscia alata, Strain PI-D3" /LENGTH=61 /DNA_ID=CAMNT_0039232149 /DNA_START=31 /DNA_END=212 /DNA_ORIENTATION=-